MAKRNIRTRGEQPSDFSGEPPAHTDQDAPQDGNGNAGFNDFLKVEHLPGKGRTMLRLSGWVRKTVSKFGKQVVIEVETEDDKTFDFGIKDGSPNHRMLFKAFGANTENWQGSIFVEIQQFKLSRGLRS